MDLENIQTIAQLFTNLVAPVAGIVLALFGWKKTGEIDLRKTMLHVEDVMGTVKALIKEGKDQGEAIMEGINKIEEIRGHKINKKMRRKAEFRIKALLSKLTP